MMTRSNIKRAGILAAGLAAPGSLACSGPCDIYASGGTPCVAAHSTTRALYCNYSGALYQVMRDSDGAKTDIKPLSTGGVANAATQDSFCAGTTCVISVIYDQSGTGNHLTQAPPGGAARGPEHDGYDILASAIGAPVTLDGHKAYGVFISPTAGYRNNNARGTARGDEAQGMYAVVDGKHYNWDCCFDYGNAETNSLDTGNGHMEALYFGSGYGNDSWKDPIIMADLENGLFSGGDRSLNPRSRGMTSRFVSAILKGKPGQWALRGGDAASGGLETFYEGRRPDGGYNPMQKEGAIILGIGGDNSDRAQGTFYEGVMTSGYPSGSTEDAVQANIVAARYGTTSLVSGPKLSVGSKISLRATTSCCTTRYITHDGANVMIKDVSSSDSNDAKRHATWVVRAGLGNADCFSFESLDSAGSFLRHAWFNLKLDRNDGTKLFAEDATYCPQISLNGQGSSLRSWSYPTRYWRHFNGAMYVASNGGANSFDARWSFNDDVSFMISNGWA
ncbi:alpha-N-arabinofuranosidase precursor [Purpureocillium lilacinum]|uniref:Alpha-L-arabinofuranosidase n=2 Tax=Purpureocillium lilacinum TaxID=33203 RepID=A0A179GJT4_PURLI|nr:alpha-N-arabinofuranosidase precursor [Purpureocillium lilacinum]KAK4094306.1 CAZyme family GH54 and CBM42 [Purpureocillium lilacinum]OAQ76589.1 alpha-N-arabinofuranosidase precursor [Purpureocillium lilacinum]OAQ78134.1 alpha-N-arabinofuranosidase precursor [Purpureocillium lilacinum]PWI73050.1 arabinofuranosidase B [Purpureocillium lilacinum]GJN75860.1 alpha-L-arabinofuranosidase [Purpureocillium lilacinum]